MLVAETLGGQDLFSIAFNQCNISIFIIELPGYKSVFKIHILLEIEPYKLVSLKNQAATAYTS